LCLFRTWKLIKQFQNPLKASSSSSSYSPSFPFDLFGSSLQLLSISDSPSPSSFTSYSLFVGCSGFTPSLSSQNNGAVFLYSVTEIVPPIKPSPSFSPFLLTYQGTISPPPVTTSGGISSTVNTFFGKELFFTSDQKEGFISAYTEYFSGIVYYYQRIKGNNDDGSNYQFVTSFLPVPCSLSSAGVTVGTTSTTAAVVAATIGDYLNDYGSSIAFYETTVTLKRMKTNSLDLAARPVDVSEGREEEDQEEEKETISVMDVSDSFLPSDTSSSASGTNSSSSSSSNFWFSPSFYPVTPSMISPAKNKGSEKTSAGGLEEEEDDNYDYNDDGDYDEDDEDDDDAVISPSSRIISFNSSLSFFLVGSPGSSLLYVYSNYLSIVKTISCSFLASSSSSDVESILVSFGLWNVSELSLLHSHYEKLCVNASLLLSPSKRYSGIDGPSDSDWILIGRYSKKAVASYGKTILLSSSDNGKNTKGDLFVADASLLHSYGSTTVTAALKTGLVYHETAFLHHLIINVSSHVSRLLTDYTYFHQNNDGNGDGRGSDNINDNTGSNEQRSFLQDFWSSIISRNGIILTATLLPTTLFLGIAFYFTYQRSSNDLRFTKILSPRSHHASPPEEEGESDEARNGIMIKRKKGESTSSEAVEEADVENHNHNRWYKWQQYSYFSLPSSAAPSFYAFPSSSWHSTTAAPTKREGSNSMIIKDEDVIQSIELRQYPPAFLPSSFSSSNTGIASSDNSSIPPGEDDRSVDQASQDEEQDEETGHARRFSSSFSSSSLSVAAPQQAVSSSAVTVSSSFATLWKSWFTTPQELGYEAIMGVSDKKVERVSSSSDKGSVVGMRENGGSGEAEVTYDIYTAAEGEAIIRNGGSGTICLSDTTTTKGLGEKVVVSPDRGSMKWTTNPLKQKDNRSNNDEGDRVEGIKVASISSSSSASPSTSSAYNNPFVQFLKGSNQLLASTYQKRKSASSSSSSYRELSNSVNPSEEEDHHNHSTVGNPLSSFSSLLPAHRLYMRGEGNDVKTSKEEEGIGHAYELEELKGISFVNLPSSVSSSSAAISTSSSVVTTILEKDGFYI
jgi:hypothetical protein